jgi:hypothetical protein
MSPLDPQVCMPIFMDIDQKNKLMAILMAQGQF